MEEAYQIVDRLFSCRFNRPAAYQKLLRELSVIGEINGPCSLLRMNGFIQEKGRFIGCPEHFQLHQIFKGLLSLWLVYIKEKNNPIERAIYDAHINENNNRPVGFLCSTELLSRINYYKKTHLDFRSNLFDELKKLSKIGQMGYLWIRFPSGFLWAFCLRKKKTDGCFTNNQKTDLIKIGYALLYKHNLLCIPILDIMDAHTKKLKNALNDKEFMVLNYYDQGYVQQDIAKEMNIKPKTVKTHRQNIIKKFREFYINHTGNNKYFYETLSVKDVINIINNESNESNHIITPDHKVLESQKLEYKDIAEFAPVLSAQKPPSEGG